MNLSKQEFLSINSAKHIQDKRKLRAELDVEMAKFLKRGGEIQSVPTGQFSPIQSTSLKNIMTAAVQEAAVKREEKSKQEKSKAQYEKQKVRRSNAKQKVKAAKELFQKEQREVFIAWGEKAGHGDMKLLSELSGVSKTALRSAFYGMTFLRVANWQRVKNCIENFDFSINGKTPKKRKPNRENLDEKRTERLNYLCKYQQERRLKTITQKYCGGATV